MEIAFNSLLGHDKTVLSIRMNRMTITQIIFGLSISEQNAACLSKDSKCQGATSISECFHINSVVMFLSTGNKWLFKTILSLP